MIQILIDAAVLIFLLKVVNDDDIGLGTAALVAFVTAIATFAMAVGLIMVMGPAGLFVAAIVAAALLGLAIAMLFGVELKRAMAVAGAFMVVHLAVGFAFQWLKS